MKKYVNGKIVEMTEEEILQMEEMRKQEELAYWQSISYEDAVNNKIRERYSESQEFAILRQKDNKPEEYAEYYAYCEECKRFVKDKKAIV